MESEEIKRHLETILTNIASIRSLTRQINFQDFRHNERMRQNVYEYLQEIAQAAHHLKHSGAALEPDMAIDTLASFRNARYNKDAEIQHQNVWNLIELDLPVIEEQIEHSALYAAEEKKSNQNVS